MLTMFDILQFAGVVAGVVFGYRLGAGIGGTAGGVVGSIAGIWAGSTVGRVPLVASLWSLRRSLKRASDTDLRARRAGVLHLAPHHRGTADAWRAD